MTKNDKKVSGRLLDCSLLDLYEIKNVERLRNVNRWFGTMGYLYQDKDNCNK